MTAPTSSLFCRRKREVKRNLDLAAKYDARADDCERNGFHKQADRWRYSAGTRRIQAAKEQQLVEAMQAAQAPTAFEQEDLSGHVKEVVVEEVKVVAPTPIKRRRSKRDRQAPVQLNLLIEVAA